MFHIANINIARMKILLLLLVLPTLIFGCATSHPIGEFSASLQLQRMGELKNDILKLSDHIDAGEASRAARIAIDYSEALAQQYEISGSPLMHNVKVNLGLKDRGLCIHWTEDLLKRLHRERFKTLDVANYESAFRLEHSSVIISANRASLYQGLVLDPWRNGGHLFWSTTANDAPYGWKPHEEIMKLKRAKRLATKQHQNSP